MGQLAVLGLTEVEERTYDALVANGSGALEEISGWTGHSPRTVKTALERLQSRGLVDLLVGGRRRWTPTPPEPALHALVHEREQDLARVRAHAQAIGERLHQLAARRRPDELVSIAEGPAAVGAHFEQLQRMAAKEVLVLDRPPYPTSSGLTPNRLQEERIRAGIAYRVVYDSVVLDDPGMFARVQVDLATGEQGRVLSGVPLKLAIGDRAMAIVPLAQASESAREGATLVIRPSVLLDSLAALFEALWARALPLLAGGTDPPSGAEPELVEVIRLLAAGMTDARIARHLRTSERTVARKVAAAMQALGADTRFQAGMLAQQQGWLSG